MGVGAGLYMYVVVVQKFTFAISSPDEFLFLLGNEELHLDLGLKPDDEQPVGHCGETTISGTVISGLC